MAKKKNITKASEIEHEQRDLVSHPVKLTDITRGLYHAASSSFSMVANQYITLISQYFDEDANGTYVPKTVEVQLPDESKMSIPLVSLVAPKGLVLDKVNFDFAVIADPSELAQATTDLNRIQDVTRSSFKVEMAAHERDAKGVSKKLRNGQVDISMQFQAIDPPEGLMRVFDKFASLVTPLKPSASDKMLPLISPRLSHIIGVLQKDERHARILQEYNDDFSIDALQRRNDTIRQWENDMLEQSAVIGQESNNVLDEFRRTYEHARIVFEGSIVYEKLLLSMNINRRTREWVNQAVKFYSTLLDDELLIEKLDRLGSREGMTADTGSRLQNEHDRINQIAEKLKEYDVIKAHLEKETEWLRKFTAIVRMLMEQQPLLLAHLFPELPNF